VETTRNEYAVVVNIQTTFVATAAVKSNRACFQAAMLRPGIR